MSECNWGNRGYEIGREGFLRKASSAFRLPPAIRTPVESPAPGPETSRGKSAEGRCLLKKLWAPSQQQW